jgi:hypothetical protein
MNTASRFAFLLLLGAGVLAGHQAQAAEGFANCTGFIDSLPATIATSGVWCLRSDLSSAQTAGAAITINASNVTLDCNDYKIGGLAAGPGTAAMGVLAGASRLNTTVRHCNLRGFHSGLRISGAGALLEDNRIDASTSRGIHADGDGALIRGNFISGTTCQPGYVQAIGIAAPGFGARVIENEVHAVDAQDSYLETSPAAVGIHVVNGTAEGNRITDLTAQWHGTVAGIVLQQSVARDNDLLSPGAWGSPISGDGETGTVCRGNRAAGFREALGGCMATDNVQVLHEI